MPDDRKRTTTERVAKHTVETVETVEYQCAVCEQWYDDESEIVPITLNDTPDRDGVYGVEQVCTACAESLFDYQGPSYATLDALKDELRSRRLAELKRPLAKFASWAAPKVVFLAVLAVVVKIGLLVTNELSTAVESNEQAFEEAAQDTATVSGEPFSLLGVAFLVLIMATIIHAIRAIGMGRGL
jgi:hypothetical protein